MRINELEAHRIARGRVSWSDSLSFPQVPGDRTGVTRRSAYEFRQPREPVMGRLPAHAVPPFWTPSAALPHGHMVQWDR